MKISCAIAVALLSAVPAAAQEDAGAVISASVGATAIESRTEWTVSGTAGYRFNRYAGLEIEVTSVPTLKSAFPSSAGGSIVPTVSTAPNISPGPVGYVVPLPTYSNPNGDATVVTTNIRVEMPVPTGRLTPYFAGGGGVAELRHSSDLAFPIVVGPLVTSPGPVTPVPIRTATEHLASVSTALALTIGGGVSVRITPHASIDGDLRYFRMLAETNTNAGRFSVGARYRF